MRLEGRHIPAKSIGSPLTRVSNLSLETPSAKRPVVDIQVWTRPDAERLSPQLAEELALQDVQSRLLIHTLANPASSYDIHGSASCDKLSLDCSYRLAHCEPGYS
jgi:hypothetical protein